MCWVIGKTYCTASSTIECLALLPPEKKVKAKAERFKQENLGESRKNKSKRVFRRSALKRGIRKATRRKQEETGGSEGR